MFILDSIPGLYPTRSWDDPTPKEGRTEGRKEGRKDVYQCVTKYVIYWPVRCSLRSYSRTYLKNNKWGLTFFTLDSKCVSIGTPST